MESFSVTLVDNSAFASLKQLIMGTRFPRLGVLSVRAVSSKGGRRSRRQIFGYLLETVSAEVITSSMCMAWPRTVSTCSLHTLVLHGLGACCNLSWSDYRHLFKHTPCLQRLCLRNVTCHRPPSQPIFFDVLNDLDELSIAFTPDMTLRLLLTSFRTPRLRVLYFAGRHFGIDTVALSECTELLSTVARLVLFVGDDGIGPYSRLFIALPRLRELELRA
jgi:hypothetical protein